MLILSLTKFKQEYSKGKFFKTLKVQNLFKKKQLPISLPFLVSSNASPNLSYEVKRHIERKYK